MPFHGFDGNDLDEVIEVVGEAAERARNGDGPTYLVANTYRFRGHSMSDAMKYRTREELERARLRDPLVLYEKRLLQAGMIGQDDLEKMEAELRKIVDDAAKFADASEHPAPEQLYKDIYSERYPLEKP